MEKKFLTYDQQIEKLQNEKQLTISDVPTAIHTLEHISYYSLISGYKNPFKVCLYLRNSGKTIE